MSKQIPAEIGCPECDTSFKVNLYRSLWVEEPANRAMVAEDRVNRVTCPSCKKATRLDFPFLCTNVKRGIAIWYEPHPDDQVEKDVALYRKRFGADSFYAKAPRVRDWNSFKTKLLELEALTDPDRSQPKISEEMGNAMSGFIRPLAAQQHLRRYPRLLSHLKSVKKRLWYSLLPISCLIVIVLANDGPEALLGDFGEFLVATIVFTTGSFAVLTAIHWAIIEYKPWRQRSKLFRDFCFGFVCWLIFTSLSVLLFDPFEYGGFSNWDDQNVLHFSGVALVIPSLIGAALYVYERFVR